MRSTIQSLSDAEQYVTEPGYIKTIYDCSPNPKTPNYFSFLLDFMINHKMI